MPKGIGQQGPGYLLWSIQCVDSHVLRTPRHNSSQPHFEAGAKRLDPQEGESTRLGRKLDGVG